MIKEITQLTDKERYTYIEYSGSNFLVGATMTSVEPDVFVDDDFLAECSLQEDLINICKLNNNIETVSLKRTVIPEGISKVEHYTNIVSEAADLAEITVYKNTMKFKPNYVICSGNWFPIFCLCSDFKVADLKIDINGSYVAGYYNNIPVIISPTLDVNTMIWGVNDYQTPGIVTFKNKEDKICNKVVSPSHFVLINLED